MPATPARWRQRRLTLVGWVSSRFAVSINLYLAPGFHIIAPEDSMIADKQATVGDHGIRPGFLHLVGTLWLVQGRKSAFFLIAARGCFRQCHIARRRSFCRSVSLFARQLPSGT